jgi:hypothetical protein
MNFMAENTSHNYYYIMRLAPCWLMHVVLRFLLMLLIWWGTTRHAMPSLRARSHVEACSDEDETPGYPPAETASPHEHQQQQEEHDPMEIMQRRFAALAVHLPQPPPPPPPVYLLVQAGPITSFPGFAVARALAPTHRPRSRP